MADEFKDQKQRHAVCMGAWRSKHGGKAPKSSSTEHLISIFSVAQDIEIRTEELDGRDHLVLPLIALVEGVYQCANCEHANFYPASEFAKNVGAWNGRPATISHPTRGGAFVSAGSPDVWQNERIGTVFNTRLDGDKLRCEAWIDPEAVERAGEDAQQVVAAVQDGEQVEVSTAAWIDEQPRFGTHAGRKFEGVQMNFQPDHIAILRIGEIGACNWEDGCGVRVAQARIAGQEGADVTMSTDQTGTVLAAGLKASTGGTGTITPCCDACAKGEPCDCADGDEDLEVAETARNIEQALAIALENEYGRYTYVLDWDEQYVYFVAESQRGIRRREYTLSDDGAATLGDQDDERVRPRTDFVVVNQVTGSTTFPGSTGGEQPTNQEDGDMADDTKTAAAAAGQQPPEKPEVPEKTAAQNQADAAAAATAEAKNLSAHDRQIAELQAKVEYLTDKLAKVTAPTPQTPEEYIEAAPAGLRSTFMQIYKEQERRRLEMIDLVASAPGCMWPREDLEKKPVEELERLAGLAARTDYSVQPPQRSSLTYQAEDDDFAPLPASPWDKSSAKAS